MWFKTLQFYTQCLGGWRKRRKALGNIMVDPKFGAPTGDSDAALDGEEPSDKPSAEGATALESSES